MMQKCLRIDEIRCITLSSRSASFYLSLKLWSQVHVQFDANKPRPKVPGLRFQNKASDLTGQIVLHTFKICNVQYNYTSPLNARADNHSVDSVRDYM